MQQRYGMLHEQIRKNRHRHNHEEKRRIDTLYQTCMPSENLFARTKMSFYELRQGG